jgi:hypothetical protein
MARGFESKAVAAQQELADAHLAGRAVPADPARATRLKRLALARVDVAHRMQSASVPAHRELLERTLAALDEEIERSRY